MNTKNVVGLQSLIPFFNHTLLVLHAMGHYNYWGTHQSSNWYLHCSHSWCGNNWQSQLL